MLKTCKVVMLPSTQKENTIEQICTSIRFGKKLLLFGSFENSYINECTFQHLYITSEEEIKENDWYISDEYELKQNTLFTAHKMCRCRKIIATTDKNLGIALGAGTPKENSNIKHQIPQISESFVKAYVEVQGIDEVQLEFEEYMTEGWIPTYNNPDNQNLDKEAELDYILKLREDNTVIIHQVKTYSFEDMKNAFNAGVKSESETPWISFNDWIEKSL